MLINKTLLHFFNSIFITEKHKLLYILKSNYITQNLYIVFFKNIAIKIISVISFMYVYVAIVDISMYRVKIMRIKYI